MKGLGEWVDAAGKTGMTGSTSPVKMRLTFLFGKYESAFKA
jgi:hypothetical protein